MDAVLISPVSPFDPRDGHRLAVLSDVHALLDNKIDLGVIAFNYPGEADSIPDLCPAVKIPVRKGGFVSRWARGLLQGLPPSAERLYGRTQRDAVFGAIRRWSPRIVIIDDASVSGYIPELRSIVPKAAFVLRSHNVMHDVRLAQLAAAKGLRYPAIEMDCKRYIEFERNAVLSSDRHWAITHADAGRMAELYGRPGECLTVSVPFERYEAVRSHPGELNGFAHVGSLDFRRRADLSHFLAGGWPRILKADETASLTLAGELNGDPIPAKNVRYAGWVKNDAEVYGLCRFALNFQSSPGGVKLKTLTSLAAGRTLLSTREGVQGIEIEPGREFFDIDKFIDRADLHAVLTDGCATQPVADAGRQYVNTHHSRAAVAKQMLGLIEAI